MNSLKQPNKHINGIARIAMCHSKGTCSTCTHREAMPTALEKMPGWDAWCGVRRCGVNESDGCTRHSHPEG